MSRLELLAWGPKPAHIVNKAYYWARARGIPPTIFNGDGLRIISAGSYVGWEFAGPIPEPVSQNDESILEEFAEKLLTRARVIDEDDGA